MSEQLRHSGYCCASSRYQNTAPSEVQQLFTALGGGDDLIVYCLDRLAHDEHDLTDLQRRLQALSVALVVAADTETNGGSHAQ